MTLRNKSKKCVNSCISQSKDKGHILEYWNNLDYLAASYLFAEVDQFSAFLLSLVEVKGKTHFPWNWCVSLVYIHWLGRVNLENCTTSSSSRRMLHLFAEAKKMLKKLKPCQWLSFLFLTCVDLPSLCQSTDISDVNTN